MGKKRFVDSNKREERAIEKVMASAGISKGRAIAILKSKEVLKQKKGNKGLLVKKNK